MDCIVIISKILDNATIAALIAVFVAGYFARKEYLHQKSIDRFESKKEELIKTLVKLKEKINYTNLIFNRIINTKKQLSPEEDDVKKFLKVLEKHEIPRLSNTLNEDIPFLNMKINNFLELYFDNEEFKELHTSYKDELENWYNKIIKEPGQHIDFTKKIEEIEDLDTSKIEVSIKELIQKVDARKGSSSS